MNTATTDASITARHLLAESTRRCDYQPYQAYVLARLAEKGDAGFSGMFSRVGDLLQAAQELQREGLIGTITCHESRITGHALFTATASIR
jgi:hypothetical protein